MNFPCKVCGLNLYCSDEVKGDNEYNWKCEIFLIDATKFEEIDIPKFIEKNSLDTNDDGLIELSELQKKRLVAVIEENFDDDYGKNLYIHTLCASRMGLSAYNRGDIYKKLFNYTKILLTGNYEVEENGDLSKDDPSLLEYIDDNISSINEIKDFGRSNKDVLILKIRHKYKISRSVMSNTKLKNMSKSELLKYISSLEDDKGDKTVSSISTKPEEIKIERNIDKLKAYYGYVEK